MMAGLTIDNPVTLAQALASENVIAGDTLLLRAGTYSGNKVIPFSGTAGNYITIKNYPGERAIIDGKLTINGSYIKVEGLEITNSTARDRSAQVGTVGVDCLGDYNIVANCIIHDHDQGITTSAAKTGHVYYGNLLYFNGWDSNGGHGTYPQNNAGNAKTLKRNLVFDNFGYGIHAWASNGDVSNFTLDGNTCFENGAPRTSIQQNILNGNQSSFTGSVITNNRTYNKAGHGQDGRVQIGYGVGHTALDVSVYDNYFVNDGFALVFIDETLTRFDGNTIIGTLSGASLGDNTQADDYPVSGTAIYLTDNEYDANRAQLTIYNWTLGNTVDVDVSSVFGASGTVKVYNVQDYFTDIQTLTITAGVITVNMQAVNRTIATPVGWAAPAKTFPQFGAFVLIKQ
jgi:hypothetical protein